MHKVTLAAVLLLATTLRASASKIEGSTTLKDSQPIGTVDKEHKHQAYDLSFVASGKLYTCRTNSDDSMNATDFIVGHEMKYAIDGKKVKIKTPEGKHVECKIVRVEDMSVSQ
jgi:gentisate 1,2-dioxygenase